MRKIGLLIAYGTEIRPFYENTVSSLLARKFEVVFLIKNSPIAERLNDDIINNSIIYDVNKLPDDRTSLRFKVFLLYNSLFIKQRKVRQRNINRGNYHFHTGFNQKVHFLDCIIGSEFIYKLFDRFYRLSSKHFFRSNYVDNIFEQNDITDLLYYGSNMVENCYFIQTAKLNKIHLWHYIGNWKDVYTDGYVFTIPTKIFVWSEKMKNEVLFFNKHILSIQVLVTGNLFFNVFKNYKPKREFEFYKKKYSINENSLLFLWPLSLKNTFPGEVELLVHLDNFIEETYFTNKPTIILRENPLGSTDLNNDIVKELKNFRMAENYWIVSKVDDFLFQSSEGETEWADLLYFCRSVISTPSTVTLESILFKKPSVIILFDETGRRSERISSFAKAPFYTDLLKRDDVLFCSDIVQFYDVIFNLNESANILSSPPGLPSVLSGNEFFTLSDFVDSFD
jgi:hypothetical protein